MALTSTWTSSRIATVVVTKAVVIGTNSNDEGKGYRQVYQDEGAKTISKAMITALTQQWHDRGMIGISISINMDINMDIIKNGDN